MEPVMSGLCRKRVRTSIITSLYLITVITSITEVNSQRDPELSESQKRDIQNVIEVVRQCRNVPGLSLSVVTPSRVLWKAGFGFADVDRGVPVGSDTLFPMGSTTKAFASTLLALLIEQQPERVSWEKPVAEMLGPEFAFSTQALTEQATLRDLLSHRSGIPGYFMPIMAGFPRNMTRKQLVQNLRYFEPTDTIRTTFQYNNYMYMLAGYVAEVIANQEWEQLNTDKLFKPLGMTSSQYVSDINDDTHMAEAYVLVNGELTKINRTTLHQVDIAAPAGAIISNADDMTHWLQFQLRLGKAPSGEYLLSPAALVETYREHMATPYPMTRRDIWRPQYPVSDVHIAYDMGWITSYYRGYKRVWHSGGITTYKSMVWLYPDVGLGLFLAENGPGEGDSTWALILTLQYITDIVLGETPWLNASTICSFPEPWTEAHSYTSTWSEDQHPGSLEPYRGTYSHPGFGDVIVDVSMRTGKLTFKMGRFMEAELLYSARTDEFYTRFVGELWYIKEMVPVKFLREGDKMNVLYTPLDSPYDTSTRVAFVRKGVRMPGVYRNFEEVGPLCSTAPVVWPSRALVWLGFLMIVSYIV